jgi:hypothetical protein
VSYLITRMSVRASRGSGTQASAVSCVLLQVQACGSAIRSLSHRALDTVRQDHRCSCCLSYYMFLVRDAVFGACRALGERGARLPLQPLSRGRASTIITGELFTKISNFRASSHICGVCCVTVRICCVHSLSNVRHLNAPRCLLTHPIHLK